MKRSDPLPLSEDKSEPNAAPFAYRDYVHVKSLLGATLKGGAFYALVLGNSGTGKTSLARELSTGLDRHQHRILYLSAAKVTLVSLVRYVAGALHVAPKRSSLETAQVIADLLRTQPVGLVVWIDEANDLKEDTLSELRSIAEFSCDVPQIFSIVLSGTLELGSLLDSPSLFALKRRISVRCSLQGLQKDELDAFLVHRFGPLDAKRVPASLKDELFERVSGTPALIDRVVRHTLQHAGKGTISDSMLREAFDVWAL